MKGYISQQKFLTYNVEFALTIPGLNYIIFDWRGKYMFLYELHMHTKEISKCGKVKAADMVKFYHELGYTGIVVTDHFFNGNTTVPEEGRWEDRVEFFYEGYEKAKKEGEKLGLDVFFAWEYSHYGTDFLTYGLDKKWLLEHPECLKLHIREYCDLVHKYGGFITQAHPFREAGYIEMIRLLPRHVDAVETKNACRTDFENKMADKYADDYCLPKIAGSDNHAGLLETMSAVEFPKRIASEKEMVCLLKSGDYKFYLYSTE